MRSLTSLTTLAFVSLGLGACATGPTGPLTATNNPSPYSVHQPVIQRTDFVFDLDASGDSLSPSERARLIGWFESIELRYADRIYVEEPRDYPSPGARRGVADVLGEYGMMLNNGAPITAGNVAPGVVRIVASRATASVPGCPLWNSSDVAPRVATSPNYGCATNANLAAMIADPNDLVAGRPGSIEGGAGTAARAVRVHRERQPTGAQALPNVNTRSGN